jgi:M6 family metalloprotease-like protein
MRTTIRNAAALAALLGFLVTLPTTAGAASATARAATASRCVLPGTTGWTDEGHDTDPVQFLPARGTIRAVMLFVDFPDAAADGPTADYAANLTPAADWMRQASYGGASLDITPVDRWLRMPQDSTTYGFDRGITFEQHELYVRQAVAAADPYVDFSNYQLVYVVPPRTAAAITFSPAYLYDPNGTGVVADGTRIKWGATFGQDMWRWGFKVLDHETSHTFGLPDLYAFTGTDYHRYVGGWDLMGYISGPAPQYFGWEAWKLRWIGDAQVACLATPGTQTTSLSAIEYAGGTKIAVVRTGRTTAYVVESRRAVGLDATACSSGALIYKVDSAAQTGYGPIQVMDATPNSTPPTGCKPLDDAAYQPGQSFTDPASGVRIEVLAADSGGDTVRISRS